MKRKLLIAAIVVLALVFLVSLGYLIAYKTKSDDNADLYEDLSQMVEDVRQTQGTDENETVTVTAPETGEELTIFAEYAALYEKNPDMVGWISIEGTKLNYPVVQRKEEKDYYLKRNFEGQASDYGAIYVQETCDIIQSDNVVIYGHNMKDGSMFAPLHGYKDKAFFEEHPTIRFDTLTQQRTYQVLSVFLISAVEDHPFKYHHFITAANKLEFDTFMLNCRTYQLYDTAVEAQYGDKLITLSTCEYSNLNGRLVVVAKLVE